MKAFTDASIIDEGSIHSFILYGADGEILLKDSIFESMVDTIEAEMYSIVKLLKKCKEKSLKNVLVFTDCKNIVQYYKASTGKKKFKKKNHKKI